MERALIVVDVQNDFCEGGALAVPGGAAVAAAINAHIEAGGYSYVVTTRDHHVDPGPHFSPEPDYITSWPPHCVAGTTGAEQHPQLSFQSWDGVFLKGAYTAAYSGFEGIESSGKLSLGEFLRNKNIRAVDICGIATDYCVDATARDALAAGLSVRVVRRLTAAVHPQDIDSVLEEWHKIGITVV